MVRRVEDAIRATVSAGDLLATPSGRGHFRVARYTGWLAVVLEKAAVITIDRSRPAKIKPRERW